MTAVHFNSNIHWKFNMKHPSVFALYSFKRYLMILADMDNV